jgi:hypothetical protein
MLNATIPQRAPLLAGQQIGPHGLPITMPNELRTSSVTSAPDLGVRHAADRSLRSRRVRLAP